MLTQARIGEGMSLEDVAKRYWPTNAPGIAAADAGEVLTGDDLAFFRSLRPRAFTAVMICIDG